MQAKTITFIWYQRQNKNILRSQTTISYLSANLQWEFLIILIHVEYCKIKIFCNSWTLFRVTTLETTILSWFDMLMHCCLRLFAWSYLLYFLSSYFLLYFTRTKIMFYCICHLVLFFINEIFSNFLLKLFYHFLNVL